MTYWSISSIVLTEEAEKLGLGVEVLIPKKNVFRIYNQEREFLFKSTDFGGNTAWGTKVTNDKEIAYVMLDRRGFPIAKSAYFAKKNWFDSTIIVKEGYRFPLVIKPVDEGHGNGVMMQIESYEELCDKLEHSFDTYDRMIVQEQVAGDEIRVLVVRDRVLLAITRLPAMIIGDGVLSIGQLIEQENNTNHHRGEGYEKPLAYIKADDELVSYIDKQGLTLASVPDLGQSIQVRGNSNLGTGGTVIDVTETLCEQTKQMCIRVTKMFGLEIAGVDILTTDLTNPLEETGGVILEVNATPGLGGHRELTNVNTGKEIVKILFDL